MGEIMNFRELDTLETRLIERFRTHPFFAKAALLPKGELRRALLQRRFISTSFTPMVDTAVDGMRSQKAIKVSRALIREEYPIGEPSHRELLVQDLEALGISRFEILTSSPSSATQEAIRESFALLYCSSKDLDFHEVQSLALVRFWGEVLVAEEYDMLRGALCGLGLTAANSKFYWPHFEHDQRKVSFSEGRSQGSHSDWLTIVLRDLLDNPEKVKLAVQITEAVFDVKYNFWNQFEVAVDQFDRTDSLSSVADSSS